MIQNTVNLLGLRAKDKVTGFTGTVTSVSFDLYGCVQAVITPDATAGKMEEAHWFDVGRLTDIGNRTMDVPAFDARDAEPQNYDRGAAPKPRRA